MTMLGVLASLFLGTALGVVVGTRVPAAPGPER